MKAEQLLISDALRPSQRFLRSAQLERDFYDPGILSQYVVTDFARTCLGRFGEGLKPSSTQRAWRITGDYGSGKSSFALILAHWFAGHDRLLPPSLRDLARNNRTQRRFVAALVTCSKQPLTISVLEAIRGALQDNHRIKGKAKLLREIDKALTCDKIPTEETTFRLLIRVHAAATESSFNGLLLVIDELGKFLEFAATNPDFQDVFLLQRLAEFASRSGKQPLFVVCLLHKGFGEYAANLSQIAQHEWEKVAGRFDQVIFDQPLEEIAELISAAIDVRTNLLPKSKVNLIRKCMTEAVRIGWFGGAKANALVELAPELYPLHPMLIPVLVRTFRRFGQNERSLFSFLFSQEPFGLQAFGRAKLASTSLYSLHNFFDYVRANFGHQLNTRTYRSHWSLIDSIVESYATDDPVQIVALKTIGILNLINDDDLRADEPSVLSAMSVAASSESISSAIYQLHKVKRALYDRGRARGLCLWPHTSVDLEDAYQQSGRALPAIKNVGPSIINYLEARPVVARRHYIETGNLRHYSIHYCSVTELEAALEESRKTLADGIIIVPLCESLGDHASALAFAKSPAAESRSEVVIGVPKPLDSVANLVHQVQRWNWVAENTPELNADNYARQEVSRQRYTARLHLQKRLEALVGIRKLAGETSLQWFNRGRQIKVRSGRDLLSHLSAIMDYVYPHAPRVRNELINRREVSSAAAGARTRLIDGMFAHPGEPLLGMNQTKTPPEMSMYLSVLREGCAHKQVGGAWGIVEPTATLDRTNLLPSLTRIRELVEEKPDTRINVAELFEALRRPPFGVRDGLIPLLLAVFAIARQSEVAFYKDGSFLREMTGPTMLVLSKTPERFEVQYCRIAGVRPLIFEEILTALSFAKSNNQRVELLDVVKPLCAFVTQLPSYALKTKKLSNNAIAVRNAILEAREPATLLFASLPNACGYKPFSSTERTRRDMKEFVAVLKRSVNELRGAYPELLGRIREHLREAFPLPGSFTEFRSTLSGRAEEILLCVTEVKLKAFCLRLLDDGLPEQQWLESVGSYLALKPPGKWNDSEEELFNSQLSELAARLHRVEAIWFAGGKRMKGEVGLRVAITQFDGHEHEQVVHFSKREERKLLALERRFRNLLAKDKRLSIAAASRAIWRTLSTGETPDHD
jgi:hypothetical protein